jgi:hypothetical protein
MKFSFDSSVVLDMLMDLLSSFNTCDSPSQEEQHIESSHPSVNFTPPTTVIVMLNHDYSAAFAGNTLWAEQIGPEVTLHVGAGFESKSGHRLSLLRIFVVLLSFPKQKAG